jgi:radical SAM superfamily enzyme YgiQ (UPF0313 family)
MTPPDVEVSIFDELEQGQIDAETIGSADIIGISGLSTSHFGAYRVAALARELGKPVVAGGMHVTGQYSEGNEEELLSHHDAIIVGRLTRRLWVEIIQDLSSGNNKRVYQAADDEPQEFVVPRHDLFDPRRYYFPALRSSAGCPHDCAFCTVNLVCSELQLKPYDILKQELELLPGIKVLGHIMPLVDCADSFGADYAHTVDVVLPLYASCGRRWFTEITVRNLMGIGSISRKPLIGPMSDAGCMGVYVGIESIFTRACAKSPERKVVEQAIRVAHDAGLIVMGSMILDITGEETEESIKETVEWVIEQGLDLLQYSLTAALPGSRTRREALAQNRLISNNPEHYDGAWPTVKHPNLPPEQLIDLLRYAYYRTYSVTKVGRRILGHTNRQLNLLANTVVRQLAHRWWGKVGYDYWLRTRQPED